MKLTKRVSLMLAALMAITCLTSNKLEMVKADTVDPIVVDITNLASNSEGSHSHIWIDKYDDTNHWKECLLDPSEKKDIHPHNLQIRYAMGETNASQYNKKITYCTDCNYYKEEPYKYPYKDSPWYFDGGTTIYKYDPDVNENYAHEPARDINGRLITENEPHPVDVYKDGVKIGTKYINQVYDPANYAENIEDTYTWISDHEVKISTSAKIPRHVLDVIRSYGITQENYTSRLSYNYYYQDKRCSEMRSTVDYLNMDTGELRCSMIITCRDLEKRYTIPLAIARGVGFGKPYDAATNTMAISNACGLNELDVYTNLWDPEITSSSITATNVQDGFAREATLNATGKIIGSASGYYSLISPTGETVISRTSFVIDDDNTYSINAPVQNVENNNEGQYILKIEDYFGKAITTPITVPKLDTKAPTLTNTSSISLNTDWAKEKTATLTYTEEGVGQVQTSINDTSHYATSLQNGTTYSQSYKFVGDIYEPKNIAIYAKDALNNYNYQVIPINKIDNTPPTITSFTATQPRYVDGTQLTVAANDINTTLHKEGSGVQKYYFSSTDPEIVSRNSHLNQWTTSNTIPITEPGEYTVKAQDQVGNESPTATLIVALPNLESISVADSSAKSVTPNTPLSDIQSLLATTATLTLDNGTTQDIALNDWTCSTFDPLVSGSYIFTSTITLPNTITNTKNIDLTISRDLIITASKVIRFDYNPLPLSFEFGTPKETIISSFNEKATAIESNTSTYDCNVIDWDSDDFTELLQGSYTFKGTIDIPTENLSDPTKPAEVTRQITIKPPTIGKVEVIPEGSVDPVPVDGIQRISVPYGTTLEEVLPKISTNVRVMLNNNRYESLQLDRDKLEIFPAYNGNTPKAYHGRILINDKLPNYVKESLTDKLYASYEITVEDKDFEPTKDFPKPPTDPSDQTKQTWDIEDIHKDLETIHVPYGLDYDSATYLLDKNVVVELENGILKPIPISKSSWKTDYFDGFNPNLYKAKTQLELPCYMTNTKQISLNLEQQMIVDPEIRLGVMTDKLPILIFPYGTPLKTILENLPTEVNVIDANRNITATSIDSDNWGYNYKRGDLPGNYIFTNHISDSIAGNQDVRQIIVIINRTIKKVEPVDGSLPDTTKDNLLTAKPVIDTGLPQKTKITLDDDTSFVTELRWTNEQDKDQPLTYHYVGKPVLPDYVVLDPSKCLTIDLTYKNQIPVPSPLPSSNSESSGHHTDSSSSSSSSPTETTSPLPTLTPIPTPTPTSSPTPSSDKYVTYDFTAFSTSWAKDGITQVEKLGAPTNLKNDRMYVPIRHVAYALGLNGKQVVWDQTERKVTIKTNDGSVVVLTPGSNTVMLNGEPVQIDGAPYIDKNHDDRVMLSLSQVAKLIIPKEDYSIEWHPETKSMRLVIKRP